MLSFVYDIADLYKTEIAVPVAFRAVAEGSKPLERQVRTTCRNQFVSTRLLGRIIPDIQSALMLSPAPACDADFDLNAASPGFLWDNLEGKVEGGRMQVGSATLPGGNQADETEPNNDGPDS
jgi:CRISPR-associated protein Cas1